MLLIGLSRSCIEGVRRGSKRIDLCSAVIDNCKITDDAIAFDLPGDYPQPVEGIPFLTYQPINDSPPIPSGQIRGADVIYDPAVINHQVFSETPAPRLRRDAVIKYLNKLN